MAVGQRYETSASTMMLALVITGTPDRAIRQHHRALMNSQDALASVDPTAQDWAAFLGRQQSVVDAATLSASNRSRVQNLLDENVAAAKAGGVLPSGRELYALSHVNDHVGRLTAAAALVPSVHLDPVAMTPQQQASWDALIALGRAHPHDWTLVGGQMVALHCWERGASPVRPTDDGDATLDVRARPSMLADFTRSLTTLGFTSAGFNPMNDHQHRWVRDDGAQVDVLIPDGLGVTARGRRGVTGGTTLSTPGGSDALTHSRGVRVHMNGDSAVLRRPHLVGAIIAKARAARVPLDTFSGRHLADAVILTSLIRPGDRDDLDWALIQAKHVTTLDGLLDDLDADPGAWASQLTGAQRGLGLLRQEVNAAR